jgi:hypothetical protein
VCAAGVLPARQHVERRDRGNSLHTRIEAGCAGQVTPTRRHGSCCKCSHDEDDAHLGAIGARERRALARWATNSVSEVRLLSASWRCLDSGVVQQTVPLVSPPGRARTRQGASAGSRFTAVSLCAGILAGASPPPFALWVSRWWGPPRQEHGGAFLERAPRSAHLRGLTGLLPTPAKGSDHEIAFLLPLLLRATQSSGSEPAAVSVVCSM